MKQDFLKIFNNYENFYRNPNQVSSVDIKKLIRYDLPQKLQSLLNLDPQKHMVIGSYGQGNLTETPWIAIYERSITESAQRGFYVVFLFRKDMDGVYLSLNQGTRYLRKKFIGYKPINKMKDIATKLNEEISFSTLIGKIDQLQLGSKNYGAAYEAANIQAKYYDKNTFPNNQQILSDISLLLSNLEKIKNFIGIRNLDQVIDELLYKEEIEDIKFQEDITFAKASSTEETPQNIPDQGTTNSVKTKWKRSAEKAKEALIKANYQCEIDINHETFVSPRTNKNFVEAHHLIPMSNQGSFNFSLDVPGNIIALCPNCHRKIHHGSPNDKKEMLKALYNERQDKLKAFGIKKEIEYLLKLYEI
ncbi:DUF3578 domain-containing protein [Bacillus sp. 37MA]|uniref:MrcB family domain-containing protein n=1 Tax=Bacillus sp. 37MA TaxID=1132442 RepID=UPI0003713C3B|nr:DUF3578 domain-containing protein [Bacillus sp. 37MA]